MRWTDRLIRILSKYHQPPLREIAIVTGPSGIIINILSLICLPVFGGDLELRLKSNPSTPKTGSSMRHTLIFFVFIVKSYINLPTIKFVVKQYTKFFELYINSLYILSCNPDLRIFSKVDYEFTISDDILSICRYACSG